MSDWLPVARDMAVLVLALFGIVLVSVLLAITIVLYGLVRRILRRANRMLNNGQMLRRTVVGAIAGRLIKTAGAASGVRRALSALGAGRRVRSQ
jgi:hypothetical protein